MQITYWTGFSKKKNSTKQPTSGTDVSVVLKNNTSLLNPTFECASVPANINYCYCSDFGRYYFVTNVTHILGGRILIDCECDVLATFKSLIGSYSAFVERAASSYDLNISDAEIYSTTEIVQSAITAGDTLGIDYSYTGTYVVTVVGKTGLKKYSLSMADIQAIYNSSFDASLASYFDMTNPFAGVEAAIQALFCAMGNPAQYVKSVKWFPCSLASGTAETPVFGFMSGTASRYVCKETAKMGTSISVPARYYNDFRDFDSRFTVASVFLPGVGDINLDPKYLQKTLTCTYYVDVNTGACDVDLFADQSEIGHFSCCVGIDVPIGGTTGYNPVGQILNAGASALSLNPGAAIGHLRGAITETLQPPIATTGASGNMKIWDERPFVQVSVTRLGSTGIPTTQKGRAKFAAATISSLSGFIQCMDASVDIPGYASEKDRVNGYLNSGFYYE